MNMLQRFVEPITLLSIEIVIVIFCKLIFIFAPDRNHAIYCLFCANFLKLIFSTFFWTLFLHIHLNWVSNEIRVLLDNRLQTIFFQILIILVIFGILFDRQDNLSTYGILLTWYNCVSFSTF